MILEKLKSYYRRHRYAIFKRSDKHFRELQRLKAMPRFTQGNTTLLGNKLCFTDSASLLSIYDEIFTKEIYKFQTENTEPYIIDAGANIGLSVIYFKQLYPNSEIVAFEPDTAAFEALSFNIESFYLNKITLVKKALWNDETIMSFYSEGADGGRVACKEDTDQLIDIQTTKLRDYLNRKVDFLKIDIEGAETLVLENCADLLSNVERLFVEYHSISGHPQSLHTLTEILNSAGFRYQVQNNGVFSPHPFLKINKHINMDLQLNIFAYRSQIFC